MVDFFKGPDGSIIGQRVSPTIQEVWSNDEDIYILISNPEPEDKFEQMLKRVNKRAEAKKPKIIAMDFDGVISDGFGWDGKNSIFHPPIAGVREAFLFLQEHGGLIVIYSARCDVKAVEKYLDDNMIPFDYINDHPYIPDNLRSWKAEGSKLVADVYVDDKAILFDGEWSIDRAKEILKFTPWMKKESHEWRLGNQS